ncbi:MAG: rab-GTPase-TBC domain-containing protein [Benjaminiella poitrasii]|nr:MAG: rab-GTPase-TBC domain-containing protein [Benjaminiella poitrasii]
MGYCEGVVGHFNAENVYFVELDPRVLESLDVTATGSDFRNSFTNSYDTSSNSECQRNSYWAKGKPSFENPFDTSAFNIDYSEEEEEDFRESMHIPHQDKPIIESVQDKSIRHKDDQQQTKQINQVDEYGFILKPDHNPSLSNSRRKPDMLLKEYRENELKWLSIVNKMDAGHVKRDAKFKKLVRQGIPASVRARVWQFLAGSKDYCKGGTDYNAFLKKPHIPIYDVIERDINRCYPDHTQFMEADGQGQKDLSCVLRAYAQYNPQLEYCQGMGRLAGLMLMQMPVQESFWLLVATIDKYMSGYFTPTLSQLRIDAYIIGQLLKDHQPKLASHLEKHDVLPIMYIAQWFLTAFTMTLPWESVLRVWDAFYFEGIKVFYRVSLAILEICKDHLLNRCPSNSEMLGFLLHIPHSYLDPNVLMSTAFRLQLSKTDIKRYAKRAGTEDATTSGLPFEHGIKNLQIGNSNSFYGLRSLKKSNKT